MTTLILSTLIGSVVLGLLFYAGHKFGKFMRDAEEKERYWREMHEKDDHLKRLSENGIRGSIAGKALRKLIDSNHNGAAIITILLIFLFTPSFSQSFQAKKYRKQAYKSIPCPHFKAVYHQPIKAKREAPGFVVKRKKRVKTRTSWI